VSLSPARLLLRRRRLSQRRAFQRVHPPAVLFPERFRGGCAFGAGPNMDAVSPAGFVCLGVNWSAAGGKSNIFTHDGVIMARKTKRRLDFGRLQRLGRRLCRRRTPRAATGSARQTRSGANRGPAGRQGLDRRGRVTLCNQAAGRCAHTRHARLPDLSLQTSESPASGAVTCAPARSSPTARAWFQADATSLWRA